MTPSLSQTRRTATLVVWSALLMLSVFHYLRAVQASGEYGFADFPIFLTQAESFLSTGELYVEAAGPDTYAPGAPVYKFPPLFAGTILPLVVDGVQFADEVILWGVQLALYPVIVVLLVVGFGRLGDARWWALVFVLALNFEPYFETLWRLQLEIPILLLLTIAALAALRGRDGRAGAALAVAFSFKIYPVFMMLFFAVTRRFRAFIGFAVAAVLVLIATLIVIGPAEHIGYVSEVLPRLLSEQPSAANENLAIARFVQRGFAIDPQIAKRIGQLVAGLLTLVSLGVLTSTRGLGPDRTRTALGFAMFVPLMLLAMPNSWVNYQLVLLLPFAVLSGEALRPASRATPGIWGLLVLAYLPMLFYAPCAEATVTWPCAQTPAFLGIAPLPRGLHDFMIDARLLSPVLLWIASLRLLVGSPRLDRSRVSH